MRVCRCDGTTTHLRPAHAHKPTAFCTPRSHAREPLRAGPPRHALYVISDGLGSSLPAIEAGAQRTWLSNGLLKAEARRPQRKPVAPPAPLGGGDDDDGPTLEVNSGEEGAIKTDAPPLLLK